jgi:NADPH:quinone reductase-like Zn-dependent oxidoreductase
MCLYEQSPHCQGLRLQALDGGDLQPGKSRVLVHAGAGGVGHFAVQLAKAHWKAFVVTTGSTKNQEFLKVATTPKEYA